MDRDGRRRRQLLRLSGIAVVASVAGCSGQSGDSSETTTTSSPAETTEPTTTDTAATETTAGTTTTTSDGGDGGYTKEETGELVTDEVDEIEILGWTSQVLDDQSIFQVEVTIRNVGDRETRITPGAYALVITYYDEGGSTLSEGRPNAVDRRNLPAGETTTVRRNVELDDPGAVARYDISLTCDSSMGVYC